MTILTIGFNRRDSHSAPLAKKVFILLFVVSRSAFWWGSGTYT